MRTHYLYRHIREDKNIPFYIGIGTINKIDEIPNVCDNLRYRRANAKHKHNVLWDRIVSKTTFRTEILLESCDLDWIKEKEKEFISLYRRINDGGTLSNISLGGEGGFGVKISNETKAKQSLAKMGDKNPNKMYPYTIERRNLLSFKLKGKKRTQDQKDRIKKSNWLQKPIINITLNKNFNCAADAANVLFPFKNQKSVRTSIARAANLKRPYLGYSFEWAQSITTEIK